MTDNLKNMTVEQVISTAVKLHSDGDLVTAEYLYKLALQKDPSNAAVALLHSQIEGAIEASTNGTEAEKELINSFKNLPSHYYSVPAYNLNWMLSNFDPIHDFLNVNPIIVADVGARGGHLGEINNLKPYLTYYAFDADKEECKRIESLPHEDFHSYKILPYYVGKNEGLIDFHLFRDLGSSSKLKPNNYFKNNYSASHEITNTVSVESRTMDSILTGNSLALPDFIKLDTQGTELEILKNSPKSLSNCLLIESEIEIIEMYDGQPLIGEFLTFMDNNGFEVLYMNRVFQNHSSYPGIARGRITFTDILFGKKESHLENYHPNQIAKYLTLLCNYGHLDIAFNIWNSRKDVRVITPGLSEYFKFDVENKSSNMNIDKSIAWQLHKRKTNQLNCDSDRSWPFR